MVALHVADGSEILADREGAEREGLRRRGRPRALRLVPVAPAPLPLADGFLPILETQYVDAAGNRYRQESFAVRASAPATWSASSG